MYAGRTTASIQLAHSSELLHTGVMAVGILINLLIVVMTIKLLDVTDSPFAAATAYTVARVLLAIVLLGIHWQELLDSTAFLFMIVYAYCWILHKFWESWLRWPILAAGVIVSITI